MLNSRWRSPFLAIVIVIGLVAPPSSAAELVQVDYPGFTLWLDCTQRGVVVAHYEIGKDTDNIDTNHGFQIDERYQDCQQTSNETYKRPKNAKDKYDLGHIVPANHLDNNADAYRASYWMTNVVPQHRKLNQHGAWRKTENLIECWREEALLEVWIGVLWGDNDADDYFVKSHGVATPDEFVKLVYRSGTTEQGQAIAWRLPNRFIAYDELMENVVSPKIVETAIGRSLNLPGVDKTEKANLADWTVSKNCDLS